MTINGITVGISESGAVVSGYLYGSTANPISTSLLSDTLLLYAKIIQLSNNVTYSGNNTFMLPVTYGLDKVFIFKNGYLMELGNDYLVSGNFVTWLNESVTLTPSDTIIAFGPANIYTAKAITHQKINMNTKFNSSDTAFSNLPTIKLDIPENEPNTSIPYDINSIYLFINGGLYSPNEHYDFDVDSQKIIWTHSMTLNNLDSVFVFYYNQHPTQPFLLGEKLSRNILQATTNNQTHFSLVTNTNNKLKNTSNLFLDNKRYTYNKDYTLYYPFMYTISTGILQPNITNGSKIDLSYFKTDLLIDSVSLNHQYFYQSGDFIPTTTSNLTRMVLLPTTDIINSKTMLFFRGILGINRWYTNITTDIETQYGIPAEWYRDSTTNQIYWNGAARNPSTPLNPSDSLGDFITWTAFLDSNSKDFIRIEYHQRSSTNIPGTITTASAIKNNKCVVFYNGQALFQEYGQFTITGTNSLVINEYSAPPSGFTDEVVVWYFSDSSYANLWRIQALNITTNIGELMPITFPIKISSIESSLLFYNGVRIDNRHYEFVPSTDNKQIRFKSGSGINVVSGSKLTIVHT